MQITSATNSVFTSYSSKATTGSPAVVTPAANGTAATSSSGIETVDFTHMTRQQLFDWMNTQIKSGKMTLDQSTPFLGMTMKVSVATGQPADMSTDTTVYNFIDRAQQGLEGARSRHDDSTAKALEQAIAIMQRERGAVTKVDLTA